MGWVGELRDRSVLRADIVAGISVATVLIPQSMANAQLASLPPYYGLYAALLPPVVAGLFGSSRHLSTGAVALVALMSSAALHPLASPDDEQFILLTIVLALMVGLLQLGCGLLKLGTLVNFLGYPVVLGFTNAGAIIIATSQINWVFGTPAPQEGAYYSRMLEMLSAAISEPHWPTVAMAALGFGLMLALRRTRAPDVLLAAIFTGTIAWGVDYESGYGGAVVGVVPSGLPGFQVPWVSTSTLGDLFSSAAAIALIGFTGTISIGRAIGSQTRQRIDANQELIGQGLSNLVGSFFQSMPVAGSFARSAVNHRSGAVTAFSSVVAGLMVVAVLFWLTPFLYFLPLATLAAIIMISVIGLVRFRPIVRAWRVEPHDGIIAVSTFVMTLAFAPNLDRGILLGIGLSLVLYLYRTMRPRVAALSRHPDGTLRDAVTHGLMTCENISVIRFDGSLYFASAGYFEDKVLEKVSLYPELKYVVVDAEGINHIDATGEEMLLRVIQRLNDAGIEVLFANTKQQIQNALERTGLVAEIGEERFERTMDQALRTAWEALGNDHASDCPLRKAKLKDAVPNYRV